jgi:hypothetical protein
VVEGVQLVTRRESTRLRETMVAVRSGWIFMAER